MFNKEGLHDSDKLNIGFHKENLEDVNKIISDIKVLDPKSRFVENELLRYLSRNKLKCFLITVTVVQSGYEIIMEVNEDGGRIGRKSTTLICEMIDGFVGENIGAAIGSLLPGMGNIICGFIGGIVGNLIGNRIGSCCCLFPEETAKGEGAPLTEFTNFIYDLPKCEFSSRVFSTPPKTEFIQNIFGNPYR